MLLEAGDDYVRRIAVFVHANERSLAAVTTRRRRAAEDGPSTFNPLAWIGYDQTTTAVSVKPAILSIDTHHLFYLLMRFEAAGLPVGNLDVRVDEPSRPMGYIDIFPSDPDKSDTLSLASIRSSLSVMSSLSLGSGWWGKPEPPTLESEIKYLFSSFTKIPALIIQPPGPKIIEELANDPPNENAIPLDVFKNLQNLECVDIDPRALLGWDLLSDSLYSLKIRKSGLEDITDIFIGAVLDDQARRNGKYSRKRHRRIGKGTSSFYGTPLPDAVPEDGEDTDNHIALASPEDDVSIANTEIPSYKWSKLRYLALDDNALTFIPSEILPYLTSLVYLDLSSNLLVSVPSGLGELYNLTSLNLSDNMIESVLGIYTNLGQILTLNLSRNRLDSICGLERLTGLERVDLRSNIIEESSEIGRLAALPQIAEVWVEGNPFCDIEENYRVSCFDYFWKEGRSILLDGTPPGFYEKRNLTILPPKQMASPPLSVAYSPPVVAVGHPSALPPSLAVSGQDTTISEPPSATTSPAMGPTDGGKHRRKKVRRIVDFDGQEHSDASAGSAINRRMRSNGSGHKGKGHKVSKSRDASQQNGVQPWGTFVTTMKVAAEPQVTAEGGTITKPPPRRSRHSRHQTDYQESARENTSDSFKRATAQGSQSLSKGAARRARVSASVYEPSTSMLDGAGSSNTELKESAEAFRQRIANLRSEVGEDWLKVFSQSQMKATS